MIIGVYGAQSIAVSLSRAWKSLSGKSIEFFIVTNNKGNPPILDSKPVLEVQKLATRFSEIERGNIEIYIATPENVQPEIEAILEENGFFHHHRVSSEVYARIMELYYAGEKHFPLLHPLPMGSRKSFVRCFVALSEMDKPLRSHAPYEEWMEPIQVGATLGKCIIAAIRDDSGENISHKNRNYSELTALYWIWKNHLLGEDGGHMYYGLMQYRRRLMISTDDLMRLEANEMDVVLPYPMMYEPDISAHPKRYLKDSDWQVLLTALRELQPVYAEAFSEVLAQPYFYNYNIILARKPVLADYCSWLFPVLERVEELSVPKGADRADRYIGYIGEVLETLYFMYHRDDLHIVHTGCRFVV